MKTLLLVALSALILPSRGALAQSLDGFDEGLVAYTQAIAEAQTPRWTGPRVDGPALTARPDGPFATLDAADAPIRIHCTEQDMVVAEALLLRVRSAYRQARELGWPALAPDEGRGGSHDIDIYLSRSVEPYEVHMDGRVAFTYLDMASPFLLIHPEAAAEPSMAAAAFMDLALLQQDPAEAPAWRRAMASYLAYRFTGSFPRDADSLQQVEPWRGWVTGSADDGFGGGLLMALLGERADGGSTEFLRDIWQLTRQRTWEGVGFRADPDMWQAIAAVYERDEVDIRDVIEDINVQRFFTGERRAQGTTPLLRSLRAGPPIANEVPWAELPEHLPVHREMDPYGASYTVVDVSDAPSDEQLRVWLRGEFGVRWSLVAVKRRADGSEIGRVVAPGRDELPHSYLAVELDPQVKSVLIVVTNMTDRLDDADATPEHMRAFKLTVDRRARE